MDPEDLRAEMDHERKAAREQPDTHTLPTVSQDLTDWTNAVAAARLALADSRATMQRTKPAYYEAAPAWERDLDLTLGVLHRLSVDAGNQDKPHYVVLEAFCEHYGTEALLGVIGRALKGDGRG